MMSGMSLFLLRLFLKQCVWIIRSQYFLWHWLLLGHFCLHLRLNNLLYLSCLPHAIVAVIWHIRLLHACTVCMLNALELLLFRKLWGVALASFFFLFYFSRLSSPKDSCLSLFQCSCLFVLVGFFWVRILPALWFGFISGGLGVWLGEDIRRSGFVSTAIMATEEMGGDAPMDREDMVGHPEPGGTTQGVGFNHCGFLCGLE